MARPFLPSPRFSRFPGAPAPGRVDGELHIIRGDSAGGSLKNAGAGKIIPVPDTLSSGPSARAWSTHAAQRVRHWSRVYSVTHPDIVLGDTMGGWNPSKNLGPDFSLVGREGLLARVRAARPRHITLWSSGTWNDLLFLSWALDALRHMDLEVRIAGSLRSTMPLAWLNPEQLVALADTARPLSGTVRAALLSLWHAFTAPTPEGLDAIRRSPPPALPTLPRGLAVHAAWFPRAAVRSRQLQVSAIDEVLLRLLSAREPQRFPDLFRVPPSRARWPRSGLYAMLSHLGEVVIEWRIASWVRAGAVEETEVLPPTANHFTRAWRLNERGREVLASGPNGTVDVPEVQAGGYSSKRGPWCCVVDGSGWRFARHSEGRARKP